MLLSTKWARGLLALWLPLAVSISGKNPAVRSPGADDPRTQTGAKAKAIDSVFSEGQKLSRAGRFDDASRALARAAELAHRAGDNARESKSWLALSACRIRLFDYRGAQRATERSRSIALAAHDNATAGSATVNLASVYLQLGDYPLAGKEAAYAARLLKNTPNKERLVKALLIYADTEAERIRNTLDPDHITGTADTSPADTRQMEQNYLRGIEVAHSAGLPQLEAKLWEELGYSLLLAHHPREAEEPLHKAYVLELNAQDYDALANNDAHQAELQLQKANYRAALDLIDRAFASHSLSFKTTPQFYPLHIRGVLLDALNRKNEALLELQRAVASADEWRQGALPGDATNTRTVVVLHAVYNDYAQLAADLALKNHNSDLAREALEVLAENRSANLREEITHTLSQKQRLPPQYFDLLRELQAAQARVTLGPNRDEDKARLRQVRLEIGGIENEFGLRPDARSQNTERNSHKNSLSDIQRRLSGNQVLLSFSLGKVRSFLWAVTSGEVNVYRLAGEVRIASLARQYSQAVQQNKDIRASSLGLSRELFGDLSLPVWKKCQWLIVGDGVLLGGIPFTSLVDLSSAKGIRSLVEMHDIRFIPSEFLLLSTDKVKAHRRFIGIGDPIYNLADPRVAKSGVAATGNPASMALARLAGSYREVRAAAKESGMPESEILVGADANVGSLRQSIGRGPQILHFAVHVVAPDSRQGHNAGFSSQAALALSLTKDHMPELLTPEAISALRIPGSLVILSGCSSQQGEILPGAGLMGLSRAWLLAGASAVVASAWPTPDDSGQFFSSFYSHFDTASAGSLAQRAAFALQQAQIDMKNSAGYRRLPKFWAAYSIISKE